MLRTIFVVLIVLGGARYALRGAFGALLLYLWFAYFRPEQWVWGGAWLYALNLSFVFGVYLLARWPVSDAKIRLDLRSALLFVFLGLSLMSMLTSPYIVYSWPYWLEFAKSIVITYVMTTLITDASRFRMVVLVMALSLGLESAKQGWATFVLRPGGINNNFVANLGDENEVAVGLLMLVPMVFALARTSVTWRERWLHRFFGFGVLYRAITTYSRGGFLALGALVIIFVLRSRNKFRSALAVTIVAVTVMSVMPQSFWDRMSTISVSESEVTDTSARGRLHFWRVATLMAERHPIFGIGHNAFNVAYDSYDFSSGEYGRSRAVHSVWFGILAELGIPAFIVYLLILLLALVGCQRVASRAKRGEVSADLGQFAIALQTSLCVVAVGGSFVPWQYNEMLWHFVGLSTALYTVGMATTPVHVTKPMPAPARTAFGPPQVVRGT